MDRDSQEPSLSARRVVVLHNRYRTAGGEERYVDQLVELLGRRAGHVSLVQHDSATTGRMAAAAALARGGSQAEAVASAVREARADVVHAHNIHPVYGWRSLAAAREAGAKVVLHLHNYRLFCAIGVVFRDGHDCVECAPRNTGAGLRHNCRGNRAEAVAYAAGIGRWQRRLIENVDLFVSPTRQLADDLRELGFELPIEVLPTWLPEGDFADRSRCGEGGYGLMAGRLTEEKGVFVAVEAAARAGVPLKIAGEGPALQAARELAAERAAPVEFTGRLGGQAIVAARLGAAYALLPSTWREVLPFAALEAQAGGLPLIVSDRGGLPELTDEALVFASGDAAQLAERMRLMHEDPALRARAGERALARARELFAEQTYAAGLARVYDRVLL
ncbi:MAG: glycosyltransferase [Actinobacteria bacterium]|nr:glycosyltransferase [Actinomycetota bacterium]